MATILLQFPAAGSADDAYRALAGQEGVRKWWSTKTEGPDGLGTVMKVAFPEAPITFDFKVVEDVPSKRITWETIQGPPEWAGTTVAFDISEGEADAINVTFSHDGWKTTEESFPFIAYSWAQILAKLKSLIETGKADPYFNF